MADDADIPGAERIDWRALRVRWLVWSRRFLFGSLFETPQSPGATAAVEEAEASRYGSVISSRPLPLDVARPATWDKYLKKGLHYWRYGYMHPDEDLLGVIDAVGDALNVQVAAAQAVLRDDRAREAAAIKQDLNAELKKKLPDFSTLLGIEARINALYPPTMARRRQWVLRERFERVAAPEAYQYWFHNWFNNPPPDEEAETADQLLAAAEEALLAARLRNDQAKDALTAAERQSTAAKAAQKLLEDQSRTRGLDLDLLRQETTDAGDVAAGTDEDRKALQNVDRALDEARVCVVRLRAEATEAKKVLERAQQGYRAAETRCAASRARADLNRKRATAQQARHQAETLPADEPDRYRADLAAKAAEAECEAAQRVYRKRAQEAARAGVGAGGREPSEIDVENRLTESKAESQTLLSYIHTSYLMSINREKTVRDLKRWLLMRFWSFLLRLIPTFLIIWLLLWWFAIGQYWALLFGLILVAAAGRAGATTSVIRRLQVAVSDRVLASDPIVELTALRTGKNEISLALMSSSIFALLMYALFISGVPTLLGMRDGIFPAIALSRWDGAPTEPTGEGTQSASGENPQRESGGADQRGSGDDAPSQDSGSGGQNGAKRQAPEQEAAAPTSKAPTGAPAGQPAAPADMTLLPQSAPEPFARLRQARAGVERAMADYYELTEQRRRVSSWNLPERVRLDRQLKGAVGDATSAQSQVLRAAESGRSQARRASDQNAAAAWTETEQAAREWLDRLRDWGNNLEGTEAPKLDCARGSDCTPFPALATALGLAGPGDFFKLLLWAFIAGFAERFVPDVLDRITSQTRGSASVPSQAMIAAQARARPGPAQNDATSPRGGAPSPPGAPGGPARRAPG